MRAPILLLGIASLLTGADTPGPFGLDPATEQEAPPVAPGADQQSPFGPDAKPGAGKPAPALRPTSHRPWTDGLRAYCTEKNLSLTETGDGPVRLLNIGGAAATIEKRHSERQWADGPGVEVAAEIATARARRADGAAQGQARVTLSLRAANFIARSRDFTRCLENIRPLRDYIGRNACYIYRSFLIRFCMG